MTASANAAPPPAIAAVLDALPPPQRAALLHLRAVISAAAPEAEEAIVYGAPGFTQAGGLVCYSAKANGLSFFPMSPPLLDSLGDAIAPWRSGKGTLSFTVETPLPDALVTRIVKARVAENLAKKKKGR